jgi:hypothetical protein
MVGAVASCLYLLEGVIVCHATNRASVCSAATLHMAPEMEFVLWICLRPLHANVRMLVICWWGLWDISPVALVDKVMTRFVCSSLMHSTLEAVTRARLRRFSAQAHAIHRSACVCAVLCLWKWFANEIYNSKCQNQFTNILPKLFTTIILKQSSNYNIPNYFPKC